MALSTGFADPVIRLKLPVPYARALSRLLARAVPGEENSSIKRDCADVLVELDRELSSCG